MWHAADDVHDACAYANAACVEVISRSVLVNVPPGYSRIRYLVLDLSIKVLFTV